jgi:hypothetical protein
MRGMDLRRLVLGSHRCGLTGWGISLNINPNLEEAKR